MYGLLTDSGLAFCLDGDPRVYDTGCNIARVPLSDFVLPTSCRNPAVQFSATYGESVSRLQHLTAGLLRWQEQQCVLLYIDDRFRFRCLLSWLSSQNAAAPKCITAIAARFLETHVAAQQKLLVLEKVNMKEIGEAREEYGMLLTEEHLQQVKDVDRGLQETGQATEWTRNLLEVLTELGLIAEQEAMAGPAPNHNAKDHTPQDSAMSGVEAHGVVKAFGHPTEVSIDWQLDSTFR